MFEIYKLLEIKKHFEKYHLLCYTSFVSSLQGICRGGNISRGGDNCREIVGAETFVGAEGSVGTEASVRTEGSVGTEASVRTEGSVGTEASVRTEESVGTEASVRKEGSVDTEASVRTEGSVGTEASVRTEVSVGTEASVRKEGSVGTEASVRTEGSVGTETSVRTEESVGTESSVRTEGSVGTETSVRTEGSVGTEASVRTEESVGTEASVRKEGSVGTEASVRTEGSVGTEASVRTEGSVGTETSVRTEESVGTEASVRKEGSVGTEASVRTEGSVGTEASVRTEGSVGTETSVRTEESVGTEASVRTEGSVGTEASVRTEGSVGTETSVRTEGSVGTEASVRTEGSVGTGASVRTEGSVGAGASVRTEGSVGAGASSSKKSMTYLDLNCQNKCQDGVTGSDCSCDIWCRLSRNCCRDLQQICPEIYIESGALLARFLHLIQECTDDNYLLVSGCLPDYETYSRHFNRNDADLEVSLQFSNILKGRGAVQHIFRQIPVTDLTSGFTFKNLSVYQCNALPGNKPLFWEVYSQTFNLAAGGEIPFDIIKPLDIISFPPEHLEKSSLNCNHKDIFRKLISDIDTPVESKNQFEIIYQDINVLCAVCQNMTLSFVNNENYTEKHKHAFAVVASFEKNKFKFQLQENEAARSSSKWTALECNNPANTETTDGSSPVCSIISCTPPFTKSYNGFCKKVNVLQLAIPSDVFPLNRSHIRHLSGFVQCFLNRYAGYDLLDQWRETRTFYDSRLDRIFYVTQLMMYVDDNVDLTDNMDTVALHFRSFAEVIKALKFNISQQPAESIRNSPEVSSLIHIVTEDSKDSYLFFDGLNFPIAINEDTKLIPVCASVLSNHDENFPPFFSVKLSCVYVPEDVMNNSTMEKEMDKNICVKLLTFSGHCSVHNSTIILFNALNLIFIALVINK
ncbi:hypothetical protein Btru_021437 [Bulinus truncatus]|nr:hypothetical protein Btru_021437 [Bulinus truncatus]